MPTAVWSMLWYSRSSYVRSFHTVAHVLRMACRTLQSLLPSVWQFGLSTSHLVGSPVCES